MVDGKIPSLGRLGGRHLGLVPSRHNSLDPFVLCRRVNHLDIIIINSHLSTLPLDPEVDHLCCLYQTWRLGSMMLA